MESAYDIVAAQMRSLKKLEHELQRMDLRWEVIDTTARVVCPRHATGFLATLGRTRESFGTLAAELVERVAATHLANRQRDLASAAQVLIDILVRNLFERTADIGFIATDADVRAFLQAPQDGDAASLHGRLEAYRAKYTVYDDIVVLDAQGSVRLRLRAREEAACGVPDWWQACQAQDAYVERHDTSPLFPGDGPVLLYAHRVLDAQGRPCGAIVLRFGLDSELQGVFRDLADPQQRVALVLMDEHGRVVASNRPGEFAPGDLLAPDGLDAQQLLWTHGGHDYLLQARTTRGYQGYRGLPWTAVALVRLESAFRGAQPGGDGGSEIDPDDERLREIVAQARTIEEGLTRVTWNGKLGEGNGEGAGSLQAVFDQIGSTGSRTVALFDDAIAELRRLLTAGRRAEMAAHAFLAVNIMDRNLYERANDCRWWALSGELVEVLGLLDSGDATRRRELVARAQSVLAHLNALYTVYRRVALFDRSGRVVAVSRDADTLPADLHIPADLLARVVALPGPQAYAVSPMQPDPLCDGAATYLYCAALRSAQGVPIGGVALAFDSATEFGAMLRDASPDPEAALGFYVDAGYRVVASTDPGVPVGERLPFADELVADGAGRAGPHSLLVHWRGRDFLAGTAPSTGYREFRRSDGYREDILAVLLTPVHRTESADRAPLHEGRRVASAQARRYGVVACGYLALALDARQVVEAISAERLVPLPGTPHLAGMLEHVHAGGSEVLAAVDMRRLSGQPALAHARHAIAVVVRSRGRRLALLVDRLVGVIESDDCQTPPDSVSRHARWVTGLISEAGSATPMIYVMDPDAFDAALVPLPEHVLREAA